MTPTIDVELERINNWLRVNLFRVRAAAEDGWLTAQYILKNLQVLQEDPKNPVTRESILRHIDGFERAMERRIAEQDRRQNEERVAHVTYEFSMPGWVLVLVMLAVTLAIWLVFR